MKVTFALFFLLIYSVTLYSQNSKNEKLPDSVTVKAIPFPCMLLDKPEEFKVLSDNSILMTAGKKTDLHNPADGSFYNHNAPKFLFTPNKDFDFSARVSPGFENLYDGGAILIWSDNENWAKVLIQNTGKSSLLGISVVEDKLTDDSYFHIGDKREIYLRLTKKGRVFNFYTSFNGTEWTLIREFVYHRPEAMKIGFYSQSPVGSACKVIYSEIKYTETK